MGPNGKFSLQLILPDLKLNMPVILALFLWKFIGCYRMNSIYLKYLTSLWDLPTQVNTRYIYLLLLNCALRMKLMFFLCSKLQGCPVPCIEFFEP